MVGPGSSDGLAKLEAVLRRRRRARILRWVAWVGVLGLAGGVAFWLLRGEQQPAPVPVAEAPEVPAREPVEREPARTPEPAKPEAPAPTAPAPEPEPLPPLGKSDAAVREAARALSSDPHLDIWLGVQDLVRRFVLAVVTVQEGKSPRKPLAHLAPAGPFRARSDDDGRITTHPASYARYDGVATVVASLDAQACARLYRRFEPLLEEVYDQIGPPDESLRDAVARAAAEILSAPRVEGEPALVFHVNHYRYRDPDLEDLSGAQKLVLRTGPDNARRIQAKVREVALALGIPAAKLPATPRHPISSP